MKKQFLFLVGCFCAASLLAETRVETFTEPNGGNTKTYCTTATSLTCEQTTWTVYLGGICTDLGKMGSTNYAAVVRGTKPTETGYGYILSDSIDGGIDSLWFDWNSNGDKETSDRKWNIRISVNGDSIGGLSDSIGAYLSAAPFYRYTINGLKRTGKFVLKIENLSDYKSTDGTGNAYRLVIDNLSWTTYTTGVSTDNTAAQVDAASVHIANNMLCINTKAENYTLRLYNQTGQLVLETRNTRTVSVEQLPGGMYVASLICNDQQTIHKILK